MSHIHEGEIHTYLDGALDRLGSVRAEQVRAHLATCEACRLRVEEERHVRAEAAQLLASTAPSGIEIPAFEEIRRRAAAGEDASSGMGVDPGGVDRGRAPQARSAFGRTQRWAWAASLVLALGTGWVLRGSNLARAGRPAAPATMEAEAGDIESPGEAVPETAPIVVSEEAATGLDAEGARRELAEMLTVEDNVGRDPGALVVPVRQAREMPADSMPQAFEKRVLGAAAPSPAPAAEARDRRVMADQGLGGDAFLAPGLEVVDVARDGEAVIVRQRFPEGDTLVLRFVGVEGVPGQASVANAESSPAESERDADAAARERQDSAEDAPALESSGAFANRTPAEIRIRRGTGTVLVRSTRPQSELEALLRSWGWLNP